MERPDDHTLLAISHLKGNSDFEKILAWIERSQQKKMRESLAKRESIDIFRDQGGAIELEDLLKLVNDARDTLDKRVSNTVRPGTPRSRSGSGFA